MKHLIQVMRMEAGVTKMMTEVVYGADGSWGYQNEDGSGSYYGADGSWGYKNADGSASYYGADGSWGYKNADGSGSYYGEDGSWGIKTKMEVAHIMRVTTKPYLL